MTVFTLLNNFSYMFMISMRSYMFTDMTAVTFKRDQRRWVDSHMSYNFELLGMWRLLCFTSGVLTTLVHVM